MNKLTVAVAQTACSDDMQKNYATAERMIAEAAEKGAKLIVFPEYMNFVGASDPAYYESIPDGEACCRMSQAAKKHNIWVHFGTIKEKNDDKPYNTAVLFDPEGNIKATYRKLHLCDMQGSKDSAPNRESDRNSKGDKIVVADTALGKIGMSICYDIRFPEQFRLMSEIGAKIICHPACFGMNTGAAHWEVLLRSTAIVNHCYILAANHCGIKQAGGNPLWGHSMIIDPWGTVLAQAGVEQETVIIADIDLDYCDELRNRLGSMNNRRTDIYTLSEN